MENVETVETKNEQAVVVEATKEPVVEVDAIEQVEKTPQKNKPTDVLRDLSKLLSVNLFDDVEAVTKVNEYLETMKTEKATLSEQVDAAIKERESFTAKEQEYVTKIEALGLGFNVADIDEVLALARVNVKDGQTISDGLKAVADKYGSVFIKQDIGRVHRDGQGDKPDAAKSEQEKYMAKSKAVQMYRKTKK